MLTWGEVVSWRGRYSITTSADYDERREQRCAKQRISTHCLEGTVPCAEQKYLRNVANCLCLDLWIFGGLNPCKCHQTILTRSLCTKPAVLISESIFKFHLASAESVIGSQTQAVTGDREWQVENIINSSIAVYESTEKDIAFVK